MIQGLLLLLAAFLIIVGVIGWGVADGLEDAIL